MNSKPLLRIKKNRKQIEVPQLTSFSYQNFIAFIEKITSAFKKSRLPIKYSCEINEIKKLSVLNSNPIPNSEEAKKITSILSHTDAV